MKARDPDQKEFLQAVEEVCFAMRTRLGSTQHGTILMATKCDLLQWHDEVLGAMKVEAACKYSHMKGGVIYNASCAGL